METRKREYPDHPILGVGGVLISEGRVLLVRRAAEPLRGEWSIPGGMLEAGETLEEAVARELLEETGLHARVTDFLEVFEKIVKDSDGRVRYHYVVCDYLCELVSGTPQAGSDVSEVTWCTPKEIPNYGLTEVATRIIQQAFAIAGGRK